MMIKQNIYISIHTYICMCGGRLGSRSGLFIDPLTHQSLKRISSTVQGTCGVRRVTQLTSQNNSEVNKTLFRVRTREKSGHATTAPFGRRQSLPMQRISASERRGDTSKSCKDFYLKTKAIILPRLSYLCRNGLMCALTVLFGLCLSYLPGCATARKRGHETAAPLALTV